MKFYKRNPDRAIAGMSELTLQERGAYNGILDLLYSRDGVLPDDDDMLKRMLSCHGNEWRAVKGKLIAKGKIWSEDGFLKANGVDETLKEAAEFSETQRKRAGKRWETAEKHVGNGEEINGKRAGKFEKDQQKQRPPDAKTAYANTLTVTDTVRSSVEPNGSTAADAACDLDALLYRRGRELLGKSQGAMITKLRRATGSVGAALEALEVARRKDDPKTYIAGICQGKASRQDRAQAELDEVFKKMGI